MNIWQPTIGEGKISSRDERTGYWPNLWLILNGNEDARFGYSTTTVTADQAFAHTSLEGAIRFLEEKLTRFFVTGDQIRWASGSYLDVASAMAAVRANPETDAVRIQL